SATRRSPRPASPMAGADRSPTCSSRATGSRSTTSSSRSDGKPQAARVRHPSPGAPPAEREERKVSVVAVSALEPFVPLLSLEAQGSDRPGFQSPDADRLVRLLAVAIGAVLDPLQRLVDLPDQLSRPVARPEL